VSLWRLSEYGYIEAVAIDAKNAGENDAQNDIILLAVP